MSLYPFYVNLHDFCRIFALLYLTLLLTNNII
nr:MAG TPA: hypothetical protein [Caudoviricetes sp.]